MESDEPVVRARDLVERGVQTVGPRTPILEVHRLLVDHELSGAPVVGDDGIVVGVISSRDLVRIVCDGRWPGTGAATSTYFRDELPDTGREWLYLPEDFPERIRNVTAADAMTRELVAVGPDATVADVARTMREHRVHRVLVCDKGTLVGVISAFDLLPVLSQVPVTHPDPTSIR